MFFSLFFFFNDTATTEIYTLSLHDALPISTEALLGDSDRVIVRSAERSPPPLMAEPLVRTWRPVPTTEALLGDSESVIVRSAERSPPPLMAEPLGRTWRPVPTTAVGTGDSAIGGSPG